MNMNMKMNMDKNNFLVGSMGGNLESSSAPQLAFSMMDLAALAPYAAAFPTGAFPSGLAGGNAMASMVPMPSIFDMTAFATPFMFSPSPVALSSQLARSMSSPPSVLHSPEFPFVPSEELLSMNLGSPESMTYSLPSPNQGLSMPTPRSTVSAGGKIKKRKKRKPKPRMADLSEGEAQSKRDSNRESARKSRDRKRERERSALDENEVLRKEVTELKLKVQVLSDLLLEKGTLV